MTTFRWFCVSLSPLSCLVFKCIPWVYLDVWANRITSSGRIRSLCQNHDEKPSEFTARLMGAVALEKWKCRSQLTRARGPRSHLWLPGDNRCLLSDSRCSEQSAISYLPPPQLLLKVLSYSLFNSIWRSRVPWQLLELSLTAVSPQVSAWLSCRTVWFGPTCQIVLICPSFLWGRFLSCPGDFLPVSGSNSSTPSRPCLPPC